MSEHIKRWDGALQDLLVLRARAESREDALRDALRVVKQHQGPLWVALYLLDVWEKDLDARLTVRHSYGTPSLWGAVLLL